MEQPPVTIHIKSISQLHKLMGFEPPKHPLISLIDVSRLKFTEDQIGHRTDSDLYTIALKDANCGVMYGRHHFDFDQGVMVFTAPNQVSTVTRAQEVGEVHGWMLVFHPDLIRGTQLADMIEQYSFFSYEAHEALHLSEDEEKMMHDLVERTKFEYEQRIDGHSQKVIVGIVDLMLSYCSRYYERQFHTRTTQNKDIVSQLNRLLKEYFNADNLAEHGVPSIQYFAEKIHLSANYLSDLLKKETGRSAKDHINDFIVNKAKNLLIGTNESISEIAYNLGFNYPHYFSRLFKAKTGVTPHEYRTAQ
ncbi:MAG TPA: AraC family transcriptional regulator [Cytophagales bacterium]|nr:AraC family transcriptional regulator [Cytophagales bacterium]HAA20552.1 AraC family transcriptional regulator [Cytophagales bacterium]